MDKAKVRQLLTDALNTRELMTLASDHFLPVFNAIGDGGIKSDYVDGLTEHVFKTISVDALLEQVKRINPAGFALWKRSLAPLDATINAALAVALTPNELLHRLSKIDFVEQTITADAAVQKSSAVAFLVHGQKNCGQPMLLKRVVDQAFWDGDDGGGDSHDTHKVMVIDSTTHDDLTGFLQALKAYCPDGTDFASIAGALAKQLNTHSIFLILHNRGDVDYDVLAEFTKQFWQPLVQQAQPVLAQSSQRLAWFLVDHKDKFARLGAASPLAVIDDISVGFDAQQPVRLKPLAPITLGDVSLWINTRFEGKQFQQARKVISESLIGTQPLTHAVTAGDVYVQICSLWKDSRYDWTTLVKLLHS